MSNEDYYEVLAKKLDKSIPRLSPYGDKGNISKTFVDYLKVLVDPEDVKYLLKLETVPVSTTLRRFAKKIKKSEEEAKKILERLIESDCVFKSGTKEPKYLINLNPLIFNLPSVRYFEFPEEKAKKLAKLSYKLFVEEEWYKTYSGSPETPLLRVIPVQQSIKTETLIMPYEDVVKIIDDARYVSLAKCMCRTRYEFLGIRKCEDKYPLETCIQLNYAARFFIERGLAREISKKEAKELCKKFNKMGAVHTIENFGDDVHGLLCNCCPCCCLPLGGITRWDKPHSVAAANYIAVASNIENCEKCETCIDKCVFGAITMEAVGPIFNNEKCMGCGVCVVNCPSNVIELKPEKREIVHKDLMELVLKIGKGME